MKKRISLWDSVKVAAMAAIVISLAPGIALGAERLVICEEFTGVS